MPETKLPEPEDLGLRSSWTIEDQDGQRITITGQFLGMGSSHRPRHKGHRDGWAPQGVHCSTCRWTEVRLFRADGGPFYIVNCGASDVPDERDLIKFTAVSSPFEVVENLTTTDRRTQEPTLTFPARRALSQAASKDDDMRDAYINSPVT